VKTRTCVAPALIVLAPAILGGCASFGPGTVQRDRLNYDHSVGESWKQQLLRQCRQASGGRARGADEELYQFISALRRVLAAGAVGMKVQRLEGAGRSLVLHRRPRRPVQGALLIHRQLAHRRRPRPGRPGDHGPGQLRQAFASWRACARRA
jgi:hypothetical protein